VTPMEIAQVALLYGVVGLVHMGFRRALVQASFEAARGRGTFAWDIAFYGSFALVVTSSVRIAGVLLVFTYLIVPAALAGVLTRGLGRRLVLAWVLGASLTAAGLYASWEADLPTGPSIIAVFGAAAALVGIVFALRRSSRRLLAKLACAAAALGGLLLVAFPHMDQPWLDALERIAPPLQTVFLTPDERATRNETIESIERARAELARLRELEQEVRWGRKTLDSEKTERLRQYIAGRGEISAGDQLVLNGLRDSARARQRFILGAPLAVLSLCGFYALSRRSPPRTAEPRASRYALRRWP